MYFFYLIPSATVRQGEKGVYLHRVRVGRESNNELGDTYPLYGPSVSISLVKAFQRIRPMLDAMLTLIGKPLFILDNGSWLR